MVSFPFGTSDGNVVSNKKKCSAESTTKKVNGHSRVLSSLNLSVIVMWMDGIRE